MRAEDGHLRPVPCSKGVYTVMNDLSPLILVADDEADIRALLRILLEKDGYRVLEADDGLKALEALRSIPTSP